jgi:molybdenum cofactor synthesis domain-containing protein
LSTARVIVASNRAAAGEYEDVTGPLITAWLAERGYLVGEPVVCPDGKPVGAALRGAVVDRVDLAITTGGTGLTPTDHTPEQTRAVLDYEIPGLANAIRTAGLPAVPTAVLSRGLAGVADRTLVVNLPGSRGGVADGLGVLDGVLGHTLSQLAGGDHARPMQEQAEPSGPVLRAEATAEARTVLRAEVSESPLSVPEHADLVAGATAGAVVSFAGTVRDHDHGRSVRELEYVCHPSAGEVIATVAADVAGAHPEVLGLAVSHRVGVLAVGDVALACAVACAHRGPAFAVCGELVDEVKQQLPVWKRQAFSDGSDEWVNCP